MTGLLRTAYRNLRYAGLDALREVAWRTYLSAGAPTPPDPVLGADWDVLIVLDACRVDLFESVVADRDLTFDAVETRISPASSSIEWLQSVFGAAGPRDLSGVGYVTGNPYTDAYLDDDTLAYVDEVWRDGWDDDLGTVPPRPVTDRAITAGRERDLDRLIVHYMQPHFPSLRTGGDARAVSEWGDEPMSVWEELRFGRDPADVWAEYRWNLQQVLDDVALLTENVALGRAVVTADHGNAFGERYIYGHPGGVDLPCLREVPWAVTTATDERTHEPAEHTGEEPTATVDDRLESLGYK